MYMSIMTTEELASKIKNFLDHQQIIEAESELPDMQFALVSVDFALLSLEKLWQGQSPAEFIFRYKQILENRFRRLTDEDSGEFGSGRDALGKILTYLEQVSCEIPALQLS
jgi:hypothetical protein